ncbi:sugar isomerase domain-containing protein [Meiothermus sp.]|uniref:sugar isomerase domain-containing protein n=1 Tax=Meiothermus sp. TaxID=1955249 RepID=UPI00307E5BA4
MSLERYSTAVLALLQTILEQETPVLRTAAAWIADAVAQDRLIYTFGTGHSHVLASEMFHRAGGLASVSLMIEPGTTFQVGALAGTLLERTAGYGSIIAERYPIEPGDLLIAISNSAANAVVLEVAQAAKAKGARVIALLSRQYAQMKQSPLLGIADLVLDNHGPVGDAIVAINGETVGPVSTVAGAFILNAVWCEAAELLYGRGLPIPAYRSSNMPGAEAHNARWIEHLKGRVRHL